MFRFLRRNLPIRVTIKIGPETQLDENLQATLQACSTALKGLHQHPFTHDASAGDPLQAFINGTDARTFTNPS